MDTVMLVIWYLLWGELMMLRFETDAHWTDIPGQP